MSTAIECSFARNPNWNSQNGLWIEKYLFTDLLISFQLACLERQGWKMYSLAALTAEKKHLTKPVLVRPPTCGDEH